MDVAAGAVIDVATASTSEPTQVFHLTNPHTTTWSQLYPVIQTHYKKEGIDIEIAEYDDWVSELGQIPQTKENAEKVPGLKLMDFYESLKSGSGLGLPVLDTTRMEQTSRTLREGTSVNGEVMDKWLAQWAF
jgi:hypothetical protein